MRDWGSFDGFSSGELVMEKSPGFEAVASSTLAEKANGKKRNKPGGDRMSSARQKQAWKGVPPRPSFGPW